MFIKEKQLYLRALDGLVLPKLITATRVCVCVCVCVCECVCVEREACYCTER